MQLSVCRHTRAIPTTVVLMVLAGCDGAGRTALCPTGAGTLDVEPTRSITADLDCDGVMDTLVVLVGDQREVVLTVSGSLVGDLHLAGSPEIIGIADFNGDGLLDVALQDFDESQVSADVLLVQREGLRFVPYAPGLRRASMYLFHDVGFSQQCIEDVRPRLRRTETGEVVLAVVHGDYYEPSDCTLLDQMELTVLDDTIRRYR